MRRLTLPTKICAICGKGSTVGANRPHSLHSTKKVIKPNLQWFQVGGVKTLICTRCRRTLIKKAK